MCLHIISYIVAGAVLSWDKSLELFVQSLEMDFSVSLLPHFAISTAPATLLELLLLLLLLLLKPPLILRS